MLLLLLSSFSPHSILWLGLNFFFFVYQHFVSVHSSQKLQFWSLQVTAQFLCTLLNTRFTFTSMYSKAELTPSQNMCRAEEIYKHFKSYTRLQLAESSETEGNNFEAFCLSFLLKIHVKLQFNLHMVVCGAECDIHTCITLGTSNILQPNGCYQVVSCRHFAISSTACLASANENAEYVFHLLITECDRAAGVEMWIQAFLENIAIGLCQKSCFNIRGKGPLLQPVNHLGRFKVFA